MTRFPALSLHAPAKLNLFLHVLGQRPDGYHDLQTLFRILRFGDTVHLRGRADGEIRMARPTPGVEPANDLAAMAARALARHVEMMTGRWPCGVDIRVDKRIPSGAGLGGGSSNAAAVLRGLVRLWEVDLPEPDLLELARNLGADVPVFLKGRDAWGEGIGERLVLRELPGAWYVLVLPDVHEPTARAFTDPALPRDSVPLTFEQWRQRPDLGRNDFEPGFFRRHPALAEAREMLMPFGKVRLTGTGSGMFLEFEEYSRAREVGRTIGCRYNTLLTRSALWGSGCH